MKKRHYKVVLTNVLLILFVSLVACTTMNHGGKGMFDELSELSEEHNETAVNYLLGPDDNLNVTVKNHSEWSGEFRVGPKGKITIPELGDFDVGGDDKETLELTLEMYLEKYIDNPRVTVDIIEYASHVVYVLGAVNNPGKYPTEGKQMTLRDAVIAAGLPSRYAALGRVFIISASEKHPNRRVVNLYRILYRGELKNNIKLDSGDVVYVPQNIFGVLNGLIGVLVSPFDEVADLVNATATK